MNEKGDDDNDDDDDDDNDDDDDDDDGGVSNCFMSLSVCQETIDGRAA